ncbi:MAG: hypothetical protein ACREFB_05780, partial [Stellaceae bacterium]
MKDVAAGARHSLYRRPQAFRVGASTGSDFPESYNIRQSDVDEVVNLTEMTKNIISLQQAQAAAQTEIDAQDDLLTESEEAAAQARAKAEAGRAALADTTATFTAANGSLQAELARSRVTSDRLEAEAREHAAAEFMLRGDLVHLEKSARVLE